MSGSALMRAASLAGLGLFAVGLSATAGMAGGNHNEPPPVYEDNYSGPPILRHIPGLRILFGDYALTEDEYNQLYGEKKKKKKIDESYYEPQPNDPSKLKPVKPGAPKAATGVAPKTTTATGANPALPQKTASATAPEKLADGPLTCDKATEVVSGFGFSSVEASSCSGKLYAFNAKRGGKSFAIKLDPATGQLTEVKKLP